MSATEEVKAPVVVEAQPAEAPPAEVPPAAEELKKDEEKPAREKKLRDIKEKKPRAKTAAHPPYFQMIKEALLALNEKNGSSPYAIAKYMEEKHKAVLPANFRKMMTLQLKNSAARGKLVKVRASYKLSEAGKKDKSVGKTTRVLRPKKEEKKKKDTTKTTAGAAATPKAPKKKPATKNKKTTATAKPKQPRSIRKRTAKKAKKAVA